MKGLVCRRLGVVIFLSLLFRVGFVAAIDLDNYKIENYNDVWVAGAKNTYCDWKPDSINDGYKSCSIEFIIWNKKQVPILIDMVKNKFNFAVSSALKNSAEFYYTLDNNLLKDMATFDNWKLLDNSNKQLDPNKIVAIQVRFEIPQYENAQWNMSYDKFSLDPDVSSCGRLGKSGVYTLIQNVTDTGTCMQIRNNDVWFDLNGYTINGDGDIGDLGIDDGGKLWNNISVYNGTVTNFGYGIALRSSNSEYYDLDTSYNTQRGMYLINILGAGNNLIHNIISNNNGDVGIYVSVNDNSSVYNNTVNNNGDVGIFFGNSESSTASDNIIDNNTEQGIELSQGTEYFMAYRNIITNSGIYGLFVRFGSQNNWFQDMIINNSGNSDVALIRTLSGPIRNNTFLNVTYDTELVNGDASLLRLWYYRAYVNDTGGSPVNNATVIVRSLGEAQLNQTPSSVINVTGILDAGNLTSLFITDGDTYNVSEISGIPGYELRINFTNITHFNTYSLNAFYDGNLGHTVIAQLWNYNTSAWDSFGEIPDGTAFADYDFKIGNQSNYILSGLVQARIEHTVAGSPTHNIFFDKINLVTNEYAFNLTTNISGYTNVSNIIDYYNINGFRHYWSLYNITATNVTCTDFHTYNATSNMNNLMDVFTLCKGVAPPANGSVSSIVFENQIFGIVQLGAIVLRADIPYAQQGQPLNFTELNVMQLGVGMLFDNLVNLGSNNRVVPETLLNTSKEFTDIPLTQLNVP